MNHYVLTHYLPRLVACALLMAFSVTLYAAEKPEPVSPITSSVANPKMPGKVVWVDLITDDLQKAGAFYHEVFGWDVNYSNDGTFADVSYLSEPLATIAVFDEKVPQNEARWLVSISVADVDAAAGRVSQAGGKQVEGPEDLPDRGRYALVEDSRGALFMLLDAAGGDPVDGPAMDNTWLWAELWTDDPVKAVGFYESIIGYKSKATSDSSGDEVLVMGIGNVARASVVKIPWDNVGPNWVPYLQVTDVDKTARTALDQGGAVLIPPKKDSDGSVVALIADPTGGVFAIQQRGGK